MIGKFIIIIIIKELFHLYGDITRQLKNTYEGAHIPDGYHFHEQKHWIQRWPCAVVHEVHYTLLPNDRIQNNNNNNGLLLKGTINEEIGKTFFYKSNTGS